MSTVAVVAALVGIFFLVGALAGILMVVAVSARRNVRFRYKGSDLSLDPDDPHDAEKIVQRWLEKRDGLVDGQQETNSAPRRSNQIEGSRSILIAPNSTRAGMGGVGGGTGLVAIAQTIGSGTTTGEILFYLAPFVSFIVGSVLYYLEIQASRYLERRAVSNARNTLIQQLTNPHTTEDHKAKIRKLLERLEESVATAELERVKLIGVPLSLLEQQSEGTNEV